MPRKPKLFEFKGEMLSLKEIESKTGISRTTLAARARAGIPFDKPRKWGSVAKLAAVKGVSRATVHRLKSQGTLDELDDYDPHALLDQRHDHFPRLLLGEVQKALKQGRLNRGAGWLLDTKAEAAVCDPLQPKRMRRTLTFLYRWADALQHRDAVIVARYALRLARGVPHDEPYSWTYFAGVLANARVSGWKRALRVGERLSKNCPGCRADAIYTAHICARYNGDYDQAMELVNTAIEAAQPGQLAMFRAGRLVLFDDRSDYRSLRSEARELLALADDRFEAHLCALALQALALSFAREYASRDDLDRGTRALAKARKRFEYARVGLLAVNLQWVEALLLGAKGRQRTAVASLRNVLHDLNRMGEANRAAVVELDIRGVELFESEDPWAELHADRSSWADRLRAGAARGKAELLAAFHICREELAKGISGGVPAFPRLTMREA